MGRRGPAPKPSELQKAQGNPSHRPINHSEPQPPPGVPECPEWLSPTAQRYWRQLVPLVTSMRVLTRADREMFALYCDTLATIEECDKHLQKNGSYYPVFDSETNKQIAANNGKVPPGARPVGLNPWPQVRMKSEAQRAAKSLAQEFGLTPASRTRVAAGAMGGGKLPAPEEKPKGMRRFLVNNLKVIQGGRQ